MVLMRHLIIFVLFITCASNSLGQELSTRTKKKIDKIITNIWEENTPTMKFIQGGTGNIENLIKLRSGDVVLGYMVLGNAPSKFNTFDFLLVFDTNLKIIAAKILNYREDYGGEITSNRWLKQFVGRFAGENMKLNDNIDGISGATISCRSATHYFNQCSKQLLELKDNGNLEND